MAWSVWPGCSWASFWLRPACAARHRPAAGAARPRGHCRTRSSGEWTSCCSSTRSPLIARSCLRPEAKLLRSVMCSATAMRAEVAFVEFISCPLTGTAPQQPRGTEVAGAGGEKSADSMRISDLHLQSDSSTAAASCERTTLPSLAASSWAGAVIERSFQNWSVRLAVNESRTPESASRRSTMGIHNAAKRSRPQCVSFGSLSASRSSSRPWARISSRSPRRWTPSLG